MRWSRVHLRTLLIGVTVLSIWLAVVVHPARQRERTIDVLKLMGSEVTFDYQWSSKHAWRPDAKSPGSPLMKSLLGDKYRANVVEIQLFAGQGMRPERFGDSHAKQLPQFSELEWLVLMDTKMTDEGLSQLGSLKKLKRLDIDGSATTQAGVEQF